MKADTLITGISITLVVAALIMVAVAFSFHGINGFSDMSAHHELVTSGAINSSQVITR